METHGDRVPLMQAAQHPPKSRGYTDQGMLDAVQNTFVVIVALVASLSLMEAVRRLWPLEKRRPHNDLIGWQLSVLGTTYAVVIGFMLYAVWTNYGTAERDVAAEANALVNLYQLATGLPPRDAAKVKALARQYCDAVLHSEWKEMDENVTPTETHEILRQMWAALTESRLTSQGEQTAADHAISELDSLAKYRRVRMIDMARQLPGVLWFILLAGAAVTIGSSWTFGAENQTFHIFQVSVLTIVIAVTLAAIADINRPFQGSVHVSDYAFRRAELSINGD